MAKEKYCDLGQHVVPVLWRSRSKVQISACNACIRKEESFGIVSRNPTGSKHKLSMVSNNEIPQLLAELEKVFNGFIRKRDSFEGRFICISCDQNLSTKLMQAGHFYPKTYSSLRFNEDNVHGECVTCNCMDVNHLIKYEINLCNKIGLKRFELLNLIKNTEVSWDREELKQLIKKYK